jgi:hypothetical protein
VVGDGAEKIKRPRVGGAVLTLNQIPLTIKPYPMKMASYINAYLDTSDNRNIVRKDRFDEPTGAGGE